MWGVSYFNLKAELHFYMAYVVFVSEPICSVVWLDKMRNDDFEARKGYVTPISPG
jgi:hypothetical protein